MRVFYGALPVPEPQNPKRGWDKAYRWRTPTRKPVDGIPFDRVWFWKVRLPERYRQPCRVLVRGAMNSCLVEFEDGELVITSSFAVRKAKTIGARMHGRTVRDGVVWTNQMEKLDSQRKQGKYGGPA